MRRIIFILLFLFIASLGLAYNDKHTRETLYGITAVKLALDVDQELQDIGISERTLQTDAELKLRLAGIKAVSEDEWLRDENIAWLHVGVRGFVTEQGFCLFGITVDIFQDVLLKRDNKIGAYISTWAVDFHGYAGSSTWETYIRSNCKDLIDEFLNAYLSVNPK